MKTTHRHQVHLLVVVAAIAILIFLAIGRPLYSEADSAGYWAATTVVSTSTLAAPYIEPFYTCVTDYYVSKSGSNSNNGTSEGSAWLTIQYAVDQLGTVSTHGGVCVRVGPGTYEEAVYKSGLAGSADTATGYLVFLSSSLHGATVQVPLSLATSSTNYGAFRFDEAEYIVIDGFELTGHVIEGSYQSGVALNAFGDPGHHIQVLNNVIHHNGGSGVGAVHTDYLVVRGNVIYNNANTSPYQNSGVSSWQAVASDSAAGFHNVISDNIIFHNAEVNTGFEDHSDGNGIIIDDFRNTQAGSAYGVYSQKTLVENNLIFGNGGGGVHIFFSDSVTVRHNTVVGNYLDNDNPATWRGDIDVQQGSNNVIVNNIAIADIVTNANNRALLSATYNSSNLNNVWENNLTYNGNDGQASTYTFDTSDTIDADGGNILGSDPLFSDPANGTFALLSSSPAIDAATTTYGNPSFDLLLMTRPNGSFFDLGAYEADVTVPTVSITSPSDAAYVAGASVTLIATSSDDRAVAGVQFKVDGVNSGSEDTASPYNIVWDTSGISDGAYSLVAVARDTSGNYATSTAVSVTVDNTAPVRTPALPTGNLPSGTTSTTLSLTTDEDATCRYDTVAATAYASMGASFATTGTTTHSTTLSSLSNGQSYAYYVRCIDAQDNVNSTDLTISFAVLNSTGGGGSGGGGGVIGSGPLSFGYVQSATSSIPSTNPASSPSAPGSVSGSDGTIPTSPPVPSFSQNLQLWDTGEDVRALQQWLNAIGITLARTGAGSPGQETILFGLLTQGAVINFQKAYSITPPSGFFGPITRALIDTLRNPLSTTISNEEATEVEFTRDLQLWDTGEDVRILQQYLNSHGFPVAVSGPGAPGNETTLFGYATGAALIEFQAFHGIVPAVGYFGPLTRGFVNTH